MLISLLIPAVAPAQLSRYVIFFKDKAATTHSLLNPTTFLSQRALERRLRYNIAVDSTDLPVPVTYIEQIAGIPGITVLNTSRWLNGITIQVSNSQLPDAVNDLPFVKSSSAVAAREITFTNKFSDTLLPGTISARPQGIQTNYFDYGMNAFNEIHLHNGEFLHNIGLQGNGLQIAILDGGFFNYTNLKAFDSVNANGQVISTWDFVARETSVVEDNPHGMQCFSIIAANIPGQFVGKAPKAGFHLLRTEDVSSEYPIEEFNWACGAEKADSIGADLISSSLGYGYQFSGSVPDYPYSDLNGDITMSARAADLAARKGLLVVNAAGNSGNDYWRMITTPADGDSVLAVGAVSVTGAVGSFSSYGPSADGRIKPDVASVGVAAMLQTAGNTIGTANGTSFACPNMAGLATCLWQGFPEFNNIRIIRALREAGSKSSSPDDRVGYGIPDMKKAFITLLDEFATFTATAGNCSVELHWTSKDIKGMKYEIERKATGDTGYARIASVEAKPGNILSTQSYTFIDPVPGVPAGPVLYRLRQVLNNDATDFLATYIDTTNTQNNIACAGSGIIISVAPNPDVGSSSLIIETSNAIPELSITVYDMRGTLVLQTRESKPAGRALFNLPTQALSNGQYIIKVMDANNVLGKTTFLKL